MGEGEVEDEVAVAVVDKQEAQEAQRVVPKGAAEKGAVEKGAAEGGLVGRERVMTALPAPYCSPFLIVLCLSFSRAQPRSRARLPLLFP